MTEAKTDLDKECDAAQLAAATSHSVTVRLSCPVKFNNIEANELKMRRPNVGEQMAFVKMSKEEGNAQAAVWLTAQLGGVTIEEVQTIDAADFQICEASIVGFLAGRPARAG